MALFLRILRSFLHRRLRREMQMPNYLNQGNAYENFEAKDNYLYSIILLIFSKTNDEELQPAINTTANDEIHIDNEIQVSCNTKTPLLTENLVAAGPSSSSLLLSSFQTIPAPDTLALKIISSQDNANVSKQIPNLSNPETSSVHIKRKYELKISQVYIANTFIKTVFLDKDNLPTTIGKLITEVAELGDIYEENLRTIDQNDIHPKLRLVHSIYILLIQSIYIKRIRNDFIIVTFLFRFIFDKSSEPYKSFRILVEERRISNGVNRIYYTHNNLPKPMMTTTILNVNNINNNSNNNSIKKVYLDDDTSESDSDSEYMKEAKERNLNNLKRKLNAAASNNYHNNKSSSTSDSDDFDDDDIDYNKLTNNVEIIKTSAVSSGNSHKQKEKKSRWGEPSSLSSSTLTTSTPIMTPATSSSNYEKQNQIAPQLLKKVTRTDPALLQYARQNFGSIELSEDDWKKAEEHYKINLLYQDMLKKRQEIDHLAKSGKFKYEYDSDEDITGGTWEHKLRNQEMEATQLWADALTKQSEGKHHIGDFLPPEELKKFMEKYDAQKNNRQPDVSDYKEYKLKEDNIGFQMLQKLGWKEGQGLGAAGSGIIDPVNKYCIY